MAKKRLSSIYAGASDRAYMYVKSKEGKNNRGLSSAMRFRIFETGNKKLATVTCNKLYLVSKDTVQIPEQGLENIRIRLTKNLTKIAPGGFFLKFLKYPHQVLRHHGMASGAKADRISQGMSNAFGKPLGLAIRIREKERFLLVKFKDSKLIESMKTVLRRISATLPFRPSLALEKGYDPTKLNKKTLASTQPL